MEGKEGIGARGEKGEREGIGWERRGWGRGWTGGRGTG